MTKYLIELTPVDMFFFGTENRYRPRKHKGAPKFEADYFQRSAKFPQQTTILGALRYLILQENGQIPISDKGKANKLIGPSGFQINNVQGSGYGTIQYLGPVYLRNNDDFYMPAPKNLFIGENGGYIWGKPEKIDTVITNQPGTFLYFEDYTEKKSIADDVLVNIKDMDKPLKYDDVFVEVEKVGINIKQEEDAYYKQISYKFKPGKQSSFVLTVKWYETIWKPVEGKKYLLPIGAEKQMFTVRFKKYNDELQPVFPENNPVYPYIILLSDAYIEQNTADFSIVSQKSFRFLKSNVQNTDNYSRWNSSVAISRSKRYNLFERGSVFYFLDNDKMNDFINKQLKTKQEFCQIGYNHYIKSNAN